MSNKNSLPVIGIIGATGFIGSHLTKFLIKKNYPIIILKRSTSNISNIKNYLNSAKTINIDQVDLKNFFQQNQIDILINLATEFGRKKNSTWIKIFKTNIIFPLKLLSASSKSKLKYFFNLDTLLKFNTNNYACSKFILRHILKILQPFFWPKTKIFNLKLAYVYGENDDQSKFIPYALEQLKNNKFLQMTAGKQEIDFVYVKDVISAIAYLLKKKSCYQQSFEEFEIGTGKTNSLKEIVEIIKKHFQSKSIIKYGELKYRKHQQQKLIANPQKLLPWKTQFSFKDFLNKNYEKK